MTAYQIGSIVHFRGREWVVMPSAEETVLSLRPITGGENDVTDVYLTLEKENLKPGIFPEISEKDIGDFESARLLRDASRLLLRNGASPLRSIGHLSFYPRPYQYVPLLMALRLGSVRLLIADDVGIGKTIEAGMIVREMLDRGEITRLAVICPPYLCEQWQKELFEKFHIAAKVIRSNTLAQLERSLPRPNLSVFEYYPFIIVSVDFVKSLRRRDAFVLHCPELVIVDEAHSCARPSGLSTTQQQRHQLIADLAKDADRHLILMTATPHSGFEDSFLSLLGFIKPEFEKFDINTIDETQRKELAKHFIQRRRKDIELWLGKRTFFPKRDPIEISYSLSDEYQELFGDIYRFARELIVKNTSEGRAQRRVRYWAALALMRCIMSSPAAAVSALLRRLNRLGEDEYWDEVDYNALVMDPTDQEFVDDIVPTHVVSKGETNLSDSEKRKLREFARKAEKLKGNSDTKVLKTVKQIHKLLEDGFKPIVFCRFIATADYVAETLQKHLKPAWKDLHVISVTGALAEEEREVRIAELCKSFHRVLVATDCLSEGINLQEGFNAILHYDLPWNPNRLEQREGRVDRFGQKSEIVKAILLYGSDNPIDGAVLNVLLRKAKEIHRKLGITVPVPMNSETVMEAVLTALFMRKPESPQLSLFEDDIPSIEVHKQWDRAADREKRSRTRFAQHAIKPDEVALEIEQTSDILGNPETVARFIKTACQRMNVPFQSGNEYLTVTTDRFPESIKLKLQDNLEKITFEYPPQNDSTYISRNHWLTSSIAEYLLDRALYPKGDRKIAARIGVIRSQSVTTITTFLLLRLRFQIKGKKLLSITEECVVTGFKNLPDKEEWYPANEAEALLYQIHPSANMLFEEKVYWLKTLLGFDEYLNRKVKDLANQRAKSHSIAYDRVRRVIKGYKTQVEPVLPVDTIAWIIVVPHS